MLRLLFSSVKNVMSVSMFNVQLSAIVIVIAKTDIYMYVVVAMLPCLVEGQLKKSFPTVFSSSLWNTHHGPQTGLLTEEE